MVGVHPRFLKGVRDKPFGQCLRAKLGDVLRGGQGLSRQDERVEFRRGRDWLEHFVDVLVGKRLLTTRCPRIVLQLSLLGPPETENSNCDLIC